MIEEARQLGPVLEYASLLRYNATRFLAGWLCAGLSCFLKRGAVDSHA